MVIGRELLWRAITVSARTANFENGNSSYYPSQRE